MKPDEPNPCSFRFRPVLPERIMRGAFIGLFMLLFVIGPGVPRSGGDDTPDKEYSLKAGFIFNFTKYVAWAEIPADGYFTIAILGSDPFGRSIDKELANLTVQGRPIRIIRSNRVEDAARAQVAFMAGSERDNFAAWNRRLHERGVLTVSDAEDFFDKGGIVTLLRNKENRLDFGVNLQSARDAKLKIQAPLLRLATKLIGEDGRRIK